MKAKGPKRRDRRGNRLWGTPKQLERWGAEGGKTVLKKRGKEHFAKAAKAKWKKYGNKKFVGGRPRKDGRPPGSANGTAPHR